MGLTHIPIRFRCSCLLLLRCPTRAPQGASSWRYRFAAVPFFAADPAGLAATARGSSVDSADAAAAAAAPPLCPYARDGLHFLHRGAHYALGGSPLALAWKDGGCSRYAVDTDSAGNVPPRQPLVLRLLPAPATAAADGAAAAGGAAGVMAAVTGDEPPVALAVLPREAVAAAAASGGAQLLRRGALFRFDLGDAGLSVDPASGRLVGAQLWPVGAAGRRGDADTCSKARARACACAFAMRFRAAAGARIGGADACTHACLPACCRAQRQIMFQHNARHAPLTYEELVAAAAAAQQAGPPAPAAEEAAAADMDA
jgi:hypothetical protein